MKGGRIYAIIDKDKKEPKAVEQFVKIGESEHLVVSKHQTRHHYLIQIKPAIESFILDAAEELGIILSDYGLKTELEELRIISKTITAKKDDRFASLFYVLRSASHMQCLSKILEYLLNEKYAVSEERILQILQE